MKSSVSDKLSLIVRSASQGRIRNFHSKIELEKWSKAKLIQHVLLLESVVIDIIIKLHKSRLPRLRKITSRQIGVKRKTKRKFSRKQLAAQRIFAKRAKAGTLRKRRR